MIEWLKRVRCRLFCKDRSGIIVGVGFESRKKRWQKVNECFYFDLVQCPKCKAMREIRR